MVLSGTTDSAIAQKSNEREMGFSTTVQPVAVSGNCEEGDNDEESYPDEFGVRAIVAMRGLILEPSMFAAAGKKRSFDSIEKDASVRADAPAKQPPVDEDQGQASPSHSYVSTLPPSSDASQDRPDLGLHRFGRGNTSTNHLSEIWKTTEEDEVVSLGTNKERKSSNLAERATPGDFLSLVDRSHSQKRSNSLPQNAKSPRKRCKIRRRRLAEDPLPEIVPSVSLLSAAQSIRAPVWEFGSYDLATEGETN